MRIWITGASSGIGEALTYEFANSGAHIIISSRKQDQLEKVRSNCVDPEKVSIRTLDLSDHSSLEAISNQILSEGPIDILINNGGISQRSLAIDTNLETEKRIMDINYFGTIALSRPILNDMAQRKKGQLVIISSVVGKLGSPLRSGYAASKHALHGYFDSVRAELHKDNIAITLICPGYVSTNVSMNALTEKGDPQNSMDTKTAAGLSPQSFAKKAIRAILNKRQEVYIGGVETYGIYVKRFFPRLAAKIIAKIKVT